MTPRRPEPIRIEVDRDALQPRRPEAPPAEPPALEDEAVFDEAPVAAEESPRFVFVHGRRVETGDSGTLRRVEQRLRRRFLDRALWRRR